MLKTTYRVQCSFCRETQYIMAHPADIDAWMSGVYIQDALPYLNPDERELLISRVCPSCWTKTFGEEE